MIRGKSITMKKTITMMSEEFENENPLSAELLCEKYKDLNDFYFGDKVEQLEEMKYEWARIPHFYTDFYVYKYATGISAAISIATKILKQGEPFVKKYIEMLKQGCSKKSIDLLKMVNVDLEGSEIYEDAIAFYNEKIEELEKLI